MPVSGSPCRARWPPRRRRGNPRRSSCTGRRRKDKRSRSTAPVLARGIDERGRFSTKRLRSTRPGFTREVGRNQLYGRKRGEASAGNQNTYQFLPLPYIVV